MARHLSAWAVCEGWIHSQALTACTTMLTAGSRLLQGRSKRRERSQLRMSSVDNKNLHDSVKTLEQVVSMEILSEYGSGRTAGQ